MTAYRKAKLTQQHIKFNIFQLNFNQKFILYSSNIAEFSVLILQLIKVSLAYMLFHFSFHLLFRFLQQFFANNKKYMPIMNCSLSKMTEAYASLDQEFSYIKQAVSFLQEILQDGIEQTYISFNGGKDATIVLFLTYIALHNLSMKKNQYFHLINRSQNIKMPNCIYFKEPHPFPEVVEFVNKIIETLNLQMIELKSKNFSKELSELYQNKPFKYIFMGSRIDDPYCQNLSQLAKADVDKGYPNFTRVNPIFRWSYKQVWIAIKKLHIPYCELYQKGYSSLGNMDNTIKNPTLISQNNQFKDPQLAIQNTERICRA